MSKRKRKNSIEVLENMREKDKEKVNDMKIKEMVAQEEIIEMAENMGDSLEDVEALREAMNEEVYNQMDRVDKINEAKEMLEMVVKVNAGIKYAVKSISKSGRGITGKQLYAIKKTYSMVVGKELLPVQVDFLKTCSEEQAKRVIYTLNVAKKTLMNA